MTSLVSRLSCFENISIFRYFPGLFRQEFPRITDYTREPRWTLPSTLPRRKQPRHHGGEDAAGYSAGKLERARGRPRSAHQALRRYGVGSNYPTRSRNNRRAQIDDTEELDLLHKNRSWQSQLFLQQMPRRCRRPTRKIGYSLLRSPVPVDKSERLNITAKTPHLESTVCRSECRTRPRTSVDIRHTSDSTCGK